MKKAKKKVVVKKKEVKKGAAKGGKGFPWIPVVAVLILMVVMVEMFLVIKKKQQMSKKPVLIGTWMPKYRGCIGIPVYGENMYIIDRDAMQVKKCGKLKGEEIDIYQFDASPIWAVQTSAGETIVMLNNTPALKRYSGKKLKGEIKIEGITSPSNFAIDSKDNLLIPDAGTSKIIKLSLDGEKIGEFGGRNAGKSGFVTPIGRIFMDIKDNVYVIEPALKKVKVFSSEGVYVREWSLTLDKLTGLENLVITNDGNVYVNDLAGSQIIVYDPKGKPLGKFSSDIGGGFQTNSPSSISGGIDNNIYVSASSMGILSAISYTE